MQETSLGIPDKVTCIVESDIPLMTKRALAEGNPLYPVPKIMSKEDMLHIYTYL